MKYVQVDTLTNNVIGYIESSFVLNDKQEGLLIVPDINEIDRNHNWKYENGNFIDMGEKSNAPYVKKIFFHKNVV